jgi:quercetin dioxygenase-like cupin family protein
MDVSPRQVFDNPVTGEHVVLLTDPRTHPDEVLVGHLFVAPGGRVAAPHLHPTITERFYVTKGRVGFLIGDSERVLRPGQGATVEPNTLHDWWQVGDEVAEVVVEVTPGVRFTEMVGSMFGLARDGKVSPEGMPGPLQLAVMGNEYGDVIRFATPPRIVQQLTIPPLALLGRLMGRRPMYDEYMETEITEEPDPEALALLTEEGRLRPFEAAA